MPGRLTELESCALGAIGQLRPCSTYQVRRAFARSPTVEWSASAGTVYPVVERLLRLRLIKAERQTSDGRGRRNLSITARGERALSDWIVGLSATDAASTPDPVRSRMHFFEMLKTAKERATFLTRSEQLTLSAIRETRSFLVRERNNSETDYLASLGGLYQLEARLNWLRLLRRRLARRLR